jgi:peptide/nickel transport system substrate-binding protein
LEAAMPKIKEREVAMKNLGWLGRSAVTLGVAMVLLALGSARPASADDKTLRAVVHADLKIIDTGWTTAYITQRHGYLVYDTLFSLDAKFVPKPQMVERYTLSGDALTYTFTLRPGLKFHDGKPVTAADCVASLKRWMARDSMGQKLNDFTSGFEVADERSFRLILKRPYGLTLESLAKAQTPPYMLPERLASAPLDKQITDPTGSGPFIMKQDEWQPGNKVVYLRNPDYVPRNEPPDYVSGGKVAKVDRIEWLYIPDNNTALSALLAGEIDYFEAPPLDFIEPLQRNPDITVLNIDLLGVQGVIIPNSAQPPFNNFKARQALLSLVNQEDFMRAVVGNPKLYLKFCGSYFMCGSANGTEVASEPLRDHKAETAKQLLKEAGYNGEKLVVLQPTDRPQYNAATMVLIQAMRRAGVNLDVVAMDWSTILGRRAKKDPPDKGGWNIFITTHGGPDTATPIGNVWFNSKCEKANVGWACDPELEKLVDDWAREGDREKRRALLDKVQERAYVSVPYVSWGQFFQPVAFRASVKGVLVAGTPVYWNIEK